MQTDLDRLNKELLGEHVSIWYVWDGITYRVLIKAPGTAIKALIKGCKLELTFGLDTLMVPAVLHTGYRIYDHPVNYLSMTGTHRFYEEHYGLLRVLQQEHVLIQFHDELCACTATAKLEIAEIDRAHLIERMGNITMLYAGDFSKKIQKSLDAFEFSLGQRPVAKGVHAVETLVIEGKISEWVSSKNTFYLNNEANTLQIDDPNQGTVLEKQVFTVLDHLFGTQLYRGPQIPHKQDKTRELTDVLGISNYGVFLIETKALNVLTRDEDISIDRKVAGIKKQVVKAIGQLVGAAKKVAEGVPVYDTKGAEIVFDRKLFPHCIVLVSELLPFGEWDDVVIKTFQATIDQPMYLNVMDLSKLMYFIGSAQGSVDKFDYYLMKRSDSLIEHMNIHAKTIILPKEKNET